MSEEKFCKNCGKQISENFKLCPYCGEKIEEEILEISCPSCGKTIKSDFKVCPYCGNNRSNERESYNNYNTENRANYNSNNYEVSPKSGIACSILCLFLGGFGVHRFYAGRIISAVILLLITVINIILCIIMMALSSWDVGIFNIPFFNIDIINQDSILGLFINFIQLFIIIWTRIDIVLIILGKFKDSKGRYIKLNN